MYQLATSWLSAQAECSCCIMSSVAMLGFAPCGHGKYALIMSCWHLTETVLGVVQADAHTVQSNGTLRSLNMHVPFFCGIVVMMISGVTNRTVCLCRECSPLTKASRHCSGIVACHHLKSSHTQSHSFAHWQGH
jgi:hypothetical protein